MSKGSTRRKCLISREEESLRWDLALGKISYKEWVEGMGNIEARKNPKGICGNCKDGLMTCPDHDYKITCRITNKTYSPHHTCRLFREDV